MNPVLHFIRVRGRLAAAILACGLVLQTNARAALTTSLNPAGALSWSGAFTNGIVTIEQTFNLVGGPWLPVFNVFTTNAAGNRGVVITNAPVYFRAVAANISSNPPGMQFIPGGTFQMGDNYFDLFTQLDELPVHNVYVSSFFMDQFEVTNEKMRQALQWAYDHGKIQIVQGSVAPYVANTEGTPALLVILKGPAWHVTGNMQISFSGGVFIVDAGKANYPCIGVSWNGAMAYGNYLSQMQGLTPCTDLTNWTCDISQNGYRPPTEAEWEKAARGALTGHVFPWASYASYSVTTNMANYTPVGLGHSELGTKPVGYFDGTNNAPTPNMANGYGIYDVAGSVREWCVDWYDSSWYSQAGATNANPTGPVSGTDKVQRGGSWDWDQSIMRCSARDHQNISSDTYWYNGCRMARRP